MTKLQIELAKARKRIAKAVHKKIKCTNVTISYDHHNAVSVYAWENDIIIASMYMYENETTKQTVRRIQQELVPR